MTSRHVGVSGVALICVLLGGLLLSSAPALALSQRGHVLLANSSFGSEGTGAGQLEKPSGIAVGEAIGRVYVADTANNRVDVWEPSFQKPSGELVTAKFVEAWGWGVLNGSSEFQRCTTTCQVGLKGTGKGQLSAPDAIAVDNSPNELDPSQGDVYVISHSTKDSIAKFGPTGEPMNRLKTEAEQSFEGVAVDASGDVWVYQRRSESKEEEEEGEGQQREGVVQEFNDAKANAVNANPVEVFEGSGSCEARPGFAVGVSENLFVDHERPHGGHCFLGEEGEKREAASVVAELNDKGERVPGPPDGQNTTAVAVNLESSAAAQEAAEKGDVSERGDVYVNNVTSISAFDGGNSPIETLGSGALESSSGVAVDARTKDVYVTDYSAAAKTDKVLVFTPQPPGPPTVDSVTTQNLTPTTTELTAQIDPNGLATTYSVQYSTAEISGSCTGPCTEVPSPPGQIEAGFGARSVSIQLQNLQPGTTYHYRVLAHNGAQKEGEDAESSQIFNTFTSLPTSAGLLPDGRAWEMISPPEKFGGSVVITQEGGLIQAAADGNAIAYVANSPIVSKPEGNRSLEPTPVLSHRAAEAWESEEIETPHGEPQGIPGGYGSEYKFFSSDLALSVVQPWALSSVKLAEPPLSPPVLSGEVQERVASLRDDAPIRPAPLSPEASEHEKTLKKEQEESYERAEANGKLVAESHGEEADRPGYLPLVTAANDTSGQEREFGGETEFVDANSDLTTSVLLSHVPLTSQPAPGGGLYASAHGQLQLISVLPKENGQEKSAVGPELGSQNIDIRNAISDNGSRIFWSAGGEEALYMRDTHAGKTIQVNAPQGLASTNPPSEPGGRVRFQSANADGSKVFFTDTVPLTPEAVNPNILAEAENPPADLYEFDVETEKLTDLTVDNRFGESSAVQGTVIGISDDGSTVYFVANGVLAPGATPGNCVSNENEVLSEALAEEVDVFKTACNLYVEKLESGTWKATFIASLSGGDLPDWGTREAVSGGENGDDLGLITSRVSPKGSFLAFMSEKSLTGYNNKDVSTGESVEEVFLYEASSKRMVCASCEPSGAPPTGVLDTANANEGRGMLVDENGVWEGLHRLAGSIPGWTEENLTAAIYQSRYLSDTGRLFFNSPDALVHLPGETNKGVENVYEYEPEKVGGCASSGGCVALISSGTSKEESAFLDASATGSDVFFLTTAPLTPQDHDASADVYDAHVCTEASPCLTPPAVVSSTGCGSAASCNPSGSSPAPIFEAPAGSSASASAGLAPAAQKGVLPARNTHGASSLTRAQRLTRALKSCRKKASRKKRLACESQARKKYGTKKTAKKSSSSKHGKR
jgi:hypothetical protein